MGADTKIAWSSDTFNPWLGCQKVAPECENCYAELWAKRYGKAEWGPNVPRPVTSDKNWNLPLKWNREAAATGEQRRVFCASLSDVFEDRRDLDAHRSRLWNLIDETPHLTWLLLTKRPDKILKLVPSLWLPGIATGSGGAWPKNVWAGTTIGTQKAVETRGRDLLDVPAPVLFVSGEPLLEAVDMTSILRPCNCGVPEQEGLGQHSIACDIFKPRVSWVIVGGESGSKFRPMDERWVHSLCAQARASGAKFFFKQDSGMFPNKAPLLDGVRYAEIPASIPA